MTTQSNMAAAEMLLMKNASAWSPKFPVMKRRRVNQFVTFYTFEDGTRLGVYANGDASWNDGKSGEQRWRGWHHCNSQGSARR